MENKKKVEDNEKDSSIEHESSSSSLNESEGQDSNSGMLKFRKFFEQAMHIFESPSSQRTEKILNQLTLDGIVEYIKKNNVRKIITMAGAGISTSAGIPDFRSPKSGLYHNLEKYNLPHPQAIFELDFFKSNPEPFFILAKELIPEGFKPTLSHYFIRLLHEKGLLLRHYTQNIDTLERTAGIPEEKLVEAHGTFYTGHCLDCNVSYDLTWIKEKIKETTVPICEKCNKGVVKPDIVFFGEMLPDRYHTLVTKDFPKADLLIIMGSSLVVLPFATLVHNVPLDCPRLLINKEKVGIHSFLGIRNSLNFNSEKDVTWLGECDKGCQLLAEKLGWDDELKNLILEEHQRLDETVDIKKNFSVDNEKASNK